MRLDKQATPISIKLQTPRHPTATRHPPERSGQVSGSFGAWCSAPARSGVRRAGRNGRRGIPLIVVVSVSRKGTSSGPSLLNIHCKRTEKSSSSILPGCRLSGSPPPQSPPQGSSSCLIYRVPAEIRGVQVGDDGLPECCPSAAVGPHM